MGLMIDKHYLAFFLCQHFNHLSDLCVVFCRKHRAVKITFKVKPGDDTALHIDSFNPLLKTLLLYVRIYYNITHALYVHSMIDYTGWKQSIHESCAQDIPESCRQKCLFVYSQVAVKGKDKTGAGPSGKSPSISEVKNRLASAAKEVRKYTHSYSTCLSTD